jgi:hypothetical protein
MDVAMKSKTPIADQPTPILELYKVLLRSETFLAWKPEEADKPFSIRRGLEQSNIMADKYYTPDELSVLWAVSTETIRSIFRDEPGVLKIGKPGTRSKRGYFTLRIPADVAERIHARLTA